MPTLNYLNPWLIDYSYNVAPSQTRTTTSGFTRQAKRSHRYIYKGPASMLLRYSELPYFEYFVKEILEEGSLKFTGDYADGNGTQTGTIRIVNGAYSVDFDGLNGRVSCEIEVFR